MECDIYNNKKTDMLNDQNQLKHVLQMNSN